MFPPTPNPWAMAAAAGGVVGDRARKGQHCRWAEAALASVAAAGVASGAAGLLALALGQPPAIYLCPLAAGAAG